MMTPTHLHEFLAAYGYSLQDDRWGGVVQGILARTGKDLFGQIANFDRMGHSVDVPDKAMTKHGPYIASAFGFFFCSMTNKFHRYTSARAIYDGMPNIVEVHPSDLRLSACHDFWVLRSSIDPPTGKPVPPLVTRIRKHHC